VRSVYVFELRPRRVPELARQFQRENVRVRGFASLAALTAAAVNPGATVAVLELDAAPADCLRWLAERMGRPGQIDTVVIGTRRTAELEPLVRELGAAEFVWDTVGGESLARRCRRQCRIGIEAESEPSQSQQPERQHARRSDQ
jgi:hypothetical protein